MATTLEVVPDGDYWGFTLEELEVEQERYKAEVRLSHTRLLSANVNSRGYQFGARSDGTLSEWRDSLRAAYYSIDPGRYPMVPATNASCVAFL